MTKKIEYISIGELINDPKLADLKLSKSTLHYWSKNGLIKPSQVVGRMDIFDKEYAIERIKKIKNYQEDKFKLVEIKKILKDLDKTL